MALKLDYVVRETSNNMRRNITLTLAAIVTMGVSLALFGCAMLLQFGVNNLSARWDEGVELILFLNRDATTEQREALETKLTDNSEVEGVRFIDEEASNQEFRRLFQRNAAMLERIEANPELLPTSYRINPQRSTPAVIDALTNQFSQDPAVSHAVSSIDAIRSVEQYSNWANRAILVTAVSLLLAALLLILNAIRMAMFARRREIEVMKLVGATNWFIRVPFMLEGVVQGVLGSAFAVVGVLSLDRLMASAGTEDGRMRMLAGMAASGSEVMGVSVAVVVLGVFIGAAGSGWAVSRFLRV